MVVLRPFNVGAKAVRLEARRIGGRLAEAEVLVANPTLLRIQYTLDRDRLEGAGKNGARRQYVRPHAVACTRGSANPSSIG